MEATAKKRAPLGIGSWVLGGGLALVGVALLVAVVGAIAAAAAYNQLVTLDQAVKAQWANVETVYQRRADLVPNLVSTVKGSADFERATLTAVTEARGGVGKVSDGAVRNATEDPAAFARFQQAQNALSASLSKLMVVVERYPALSSTQGFRDLQSQLEGTENRIAVARMRFNEAAEAFNAQRNSFPTIVLVGFFGSRFGEKSFFEAVPSARTAPRVDFSAPNSSVR